MRHITHNSRDYIVTRVRKGEVELVDSLTVETLRVPESSVDWSTSHSVDRPTDLTIRLFDNRPRDFVVDVRKRRQLLLSERFTHDKDGNLLKTKGAKRPPKDSKPGEASSRTSKPRGASALERAKALALSRLSPELRAQVEQAMKGVRS